MVEKYSVSLMKFLQQGISEPEFYGDLDYRIIKIVGKSKKFRNTSEKLISRYKRIIFNKWVGADDMSLAWPTMVQLFVVFCLCVVVFFLFFVVLLLLFFFLFFFFCLFCFFVCLFVFCCCFLFVCFFCCCCCCFLLF